MPKSPEQFGTGPSDSDREQRRIAEELKDIKKDLDRHDQERELSKERVRAKFILEVGAVVRRAVAERIKNHAFSRTVEVNLDESKGLLSSTFRIELKGGREDVQVILDDIKYLVEQLAKDSEK